MIGNDVDIPMSGEQTMKASKLLSLCKEYIINPLKTLLQKSDTGKQQYSDIIVRNGRGEILLLERSYRDDTGAGEWCLPGGHREPGEDPLKAAKRELAEETGLYVDNVRLIGVKEKPECTIHYYEVVVAEPRYSEGMLAAPTAIILDNEEHYRYQWVSMFDLKDYKLIFDLGSYIEDLLLNTTPIVYNAPSKPEDVIWKYWIEANDELEKNFSVVTKAFDEDMITPEQYTSAREQYLDKKKYLSLLIVQDGFDKGLVSEEKYIAAMKNSGHLVN